MDIDHEIGRGVNTFTFKEETEGYHYITMSACEALNVYMGMGKTRYLV